MKKKANKPEPQIATQHPIHQWRFAPRDLREAFAKVEAENAQLKARIASEEALTKRLLPHELSLIAQLLEDASNTYSNHGCNDFKLPDNRRHVDMLVQMAKWSEPILTDDSEEIIDIKRNSPFTYDYLLMSFLAHRCREQLEEEAG